MKGKVLSFGAHPDDIEIGCGGTEVRLVRQGYEVTHAYLTSGEAGSHTVSPEALARAREEEARTAAAAIGAVRVRFFRYADGLTSFTRAMRLEVINLIRRLRPEIIFLHATSDAFPDHVVVRELVSSAIAGAGGPWYQEAGREPWSPSIVLGYEVWHPLPDHRLAIDVSETIDAKSEALACYRTQIQNTRYDEACLGLARYRGVMTGVGRYAEVFEVVRADGLATAMDW